MEDSNTPIQNFELIQAIDRMNQSNSREDREAVLDQVV